MKKIIALSLALIIALSLCVACGGNTEAPNKSSVNVKGKVDLSIGLPSSATVLSYEDNALTLWVEEQTGFDLSFIPFSGGTDVGTQISTTVAARQELPDILYDISLGEEVYRGYGHDGYFLDLSKYFDDREGASKTFWTRLEENFSPEEQADILRKMKDPDTGAIYAVPTLELSQIDTMDYQMWINVEWLDKLELEMPTDIDSLYNVLVAFRDGDPNGNGKKDEIPLYGGQEAGLGADVINWLVNMFLYFNDRRTFMVDDDNQLYAPFITDDYREAMKFLNKLMDEKLMLDAVFNAKHAELKLVNTPNSGVPIAGIFAGHLTLHANCDNPVLQQYQPLPLWSNVVYNDNNCFMTTFITKDCENPDAAFELMMTLYTEDGSRRLRYGEYGVNWTDADPGAVSTMGLEADFKLIRDPMLEQNTCLWSSASCSLNVNSEGESAQLTGQETAGEVLRGKMHAESRKLHDAAAEKYNPDPKYICPVLVYTEEEKEDSEVASTAVGDYFRKSRTDFALGNLDPNSDADWKEYVDTLWELGLQDWLDVAQVAYDRG